MDSTQNKEAHVNLIEEKINGTNECKNHPTWKRISSALFFGFTAFLNVILLKYILSTYKFPSPQITSFGQTLSPVVILFIAKTFNLIDIPKLNVSIFRNILLLSVANVGKVTFMNSCIPLLSLPMFTVFGRIIILITMIAEYFILKTKPSKWVQFSVYVMMVGAIVAAVNDLTFDLIGYTYALLGDIFASAESVIAKQKLGSNELNVYSLIYYKCLFSSAPMALIAYLMSDMEKVTSYSNWSDPLLIVLFITMCVLGFIYKYSITLCIHYNSALTASIVVCIKNILVTYVGMFISIDYLFSWLNFAGLNISILGSILYVWIVCKPKKEIVKSTSTVQVAGKTDVELTFDFKNTLNSV